MKQTLCFAFLALTWAAIGQSQAVGQNTVWTNLTIPGVPQAGDQGSVTLGLKFYSDVAGSVTAVRFYKGLSNTGTHIGNLWSINGTKLAEVTFSGETASGWQQANFSPSIQIAANTPYVISYLAPKGRYAYDSSYSWSTINSLPLHLSGTSPGVYTYSSPQALFPNSAWNSTNYWVDLVFVPGAPNSPITYGISGKVIGSPAKLTLSGPSSAVATTDASGNYTFSGLANGSYVVTPSQSGFTFTPATVPINGASKSAINFIATAVAVPHTISLTWTLSTSPSISGYNVYRSNVSGGPYTKVNASPIATTSYLDSTVASGQAYFYVATTVQSSVESTYSTEAAAAVPLP